MKHIDITCDPKLLIPLHALKGIQGSLKTMQTADFDRLTRSLEKDGIDFSFHVWNPNRKTDLPADWHLVDGHGRALVLNELLRRGGHELAGELIPATETFAKDLKEARRKVLRSSSVYHKMTNQGLYEFMNESGFTIEEIESEYSLPDIDIPEFKVEFFDDGEPEVEGGEKHRVEFDAYQNAAVKQIVLYYPKETYDNVISLFDELCQKWDFQDHSQVVFRLLNDAFRASAKEN